MIYLIHLAALLVSGAVAFMAERQLKPNSSDEVALLSARKQINAASVIGPISLILGGILLGSVGLILAILAWRKLNALLQKKSLLAEDASRLLKSAKIAMAVCMIAIVLNLISFMVVYPQLMEMIDSGQFDYLLGATTSGSDSAVGNSTWG